jgi:putative ABC transport system permease protein
MLRKNPGFTITAVLALMLGIASSTVIFSVVSGVLLRPLPYPDAERLVALTQTVRTTDAQRDATSAANFKDWAEQNDVFAAIAAARGWQGNLSDGATPERVRATMVTPSFFQVFSTPPLLGRALTADDAGPGSANVLVLSHALWQRRFGGDRNIVGRQVRFDGEPRTVVGVMPPAFSPDDYAELWSPSPFGIPTHALRPTVDPQQSRDSNYLDVSAKLKPGVTVARAQAEMSAIMARLEQQYPNANTDAGVSVVALHEDKVGSLRPVLLILLAAVGFLLLIGCANVANLQLARGATRAREVSIRTALGATRARVVRQLLTESILLALLGGGIGILLAAWAIPVLMALAPAGLTAFNDVSLNRGVLLFSVALSLVTGIGFGLAPAFFASSANPSDSLGEGGRGSTGATSRSRSILIATEVALTLILLIAAGLMLKSFSKLMQVDPGFVPDNLLVFDIGLPPTADETHNRAFYEQVVDRLRALPGVDRVAAVSRLPMSGGNSSRDFNVMGREKSHSADIRIATSDYFRAMGIPLLRGRSFDERDTKTAPQVAVINEAAAREIFPDEDPIGKFVTNFGPNDETMQIVGVIGNIRHVTLEDAPRAEIYQPLGQAMWPRMFFAVRAASSNPLSLLPSVQSAIRSVDPNVALGSPRTMQDTIARSLLQRKFTMTLLTIFAGIAVALAAIGLFGVMSYSVAQRTREIGIRMAVGAQRSDVLRLIVQQGMTLTVVGVVCGLFGAFALTRLMANLLYAVSATDAVTFGGVSVFLASISLLACWIPARRAARVDPMITLRSE